MNTQKAMYITFLSLSTFFSASMGLKCKEIEWWSYGGVTYKAWWESKARGYGTTTLGKYRLRKERKGEDSKWGNGGLPCLAKRRKKESSHHKKTLNKTKTKPPKANGYGLAFISLSLSWLPKLKVTFEYSFRLFPIFPLWYCTHKRREWTAVPLLFTVFSLLYIPLYIYIYIYIHTHIY